MSVLDHPLIPLSNEELEAARQKELDDAPKFLDDGYVTLQYGGVEYYYIDLNRIKTPEELLAWVNQLCNKSWMTPSRTKRFINAMCRRNGWSLELPR